MRGAVIGGGAEGRGPACPRTPVATGRRLAACALAALALGGCARRERAPAAIAPRTPLPVSVLADTEARLTLRAGALGAPPRSASATLVRVAPRREALDLPLPEAPPAPPPAEGAPAEAAHDVLLPPIARDVLRLALPGARPGAVELDVRVDERGTVSDVALASPVADTALAGAALRAARATRWYPALLHGRPVAVWCRQRIEIGR